MSCDVMTSPSVDVLRTLRRSAITATIKIKKMLPVTIPTRTKISLPSTPVTVLVMRAEVVIITVVVVLLLVSRH